MSDQDKHGTPDELGLSALEDTYDIIGELRGVDDLRCYLARRRTSNVDVMITVVPAGTAAENNALTLYAADVNILSGVSHRGVLQAIEGHWLSGGSFAAVTERPRGPTIGEMLSGNDRFENPQIASLLREVNAALVWARSLGVVHRGVNVDAMYLEPTTGSLEIALLPVPIPAAGIPGEATDARTLGDLAFTLLAGHDPEADPRGDSLAEIRPDLASQVVKAVEGMRSATRENLPDVDAFAALIASADVLKQAEAELALQRAQLAEAQRRRRSGWDSESARWRRRALEAESRLETTRFSTTPRHFRAIVPAILIVVLLAAALGYRASHRRREHAADVAKASPAVVNRVPTPAAPASIDSSRQTAAGSVAPADSTDDSTGMRRPSKPTPAAQPFENPHTAAAADSARIRRLRLQRRPPDSTSTDGTRVTDTTRAAAMFMPQPTLRSATRVCRFFEPDSTTRDTTVLPDSGPRDSLRRMRRRGAVRCDSTSSPHG